MKLSFPDVNVWIALAVGRHVHHKAARAWWDADESDVIGFCRTTQLGLLRLLTSSAAMGGAPLTNHEAWAAYDAFCEDGRVRMLPELAPIDKLFRRHSGIHQPSAKIWADCYLAAHAVASRATLITFDRCFANYGIECVILSQQS